MRPTKRNIARRIDDLGGGEADLPGDVLVIGGDPDKAGWFTREEYERLHGDADTDGDGDRDEGSDR